MMVYDQDDDFEQWTGEMPASAWLAFLQHKAYAESREDD